MLIQFDMFYFLTVKQCFHTPVYNLEVFETLIDIKHHIKTSALQGRRCLIFLFLFYSSKYLFCNNEKLYSKVTFPKQ